AQGLGVAKHCSPINGSRARASYACKFTSASRLTRPRHSSVRHLCATAGEQRAGRALVMSDNQCNALVFFGATGDLAYKKIFPSLQAMIKRGHLNVPVIGVAKAGWNLEQLRARAHDSLEKHGGVDAAALNKLIGFFGY